MNIKIFFLTFIVKRGSQFNGVIVRIFRTKTMKLISKHFFYKKDSDFIILKDLTLTKP